MRGVLAASTGPRAGSAAPKFPQPMTLEFLLRQHARTGAAQALGAVN